MVRCVDDQYQVAREAPRDRRQRGYAGRSGRTDRTDYTGDAGELHPGRSSGTRDADRPRRTRDVFCSKGTRRPRGRVPYRSRAPSGSYQSDRSRGSHGPNHTGSCCSRDPHRAGGSSRPDCAHGTGGSAWSTGSAWTRYRRRAAIQAPLVPNAIWLCHYRRYP